MRKNDAKALGCLSLLIGGLLSIFIPIFLIGNKIYSDVVWVFLAPGWFILRPGAHDGLVILLATFLDTIIFAALNYGIIYCVVRFSGRAKYE